MASQYIKLPVVTGSGGGAVDSFNGRTGVVVSQAGDYSATLVNNTPSGNISATTVQALILLKKPLAAMTAEERRLLPLAIKLVSQIMAG